MPSMHPIKYANCNHFLHLLIISQIIIAPLL